MDENELIPLELYCTSTHVEAAFIDAMVESGLVEVTVVHEQRYIPHGQLVRLDRLVRLHDDLGINEAGVEAIEHMLERISELQHEVWALRNRLRRFGEF